MRRKLLLITAAFISGIVYMHCFETVWIPATAFFAGAVFLITGFAGRGARCDSGTGSGSRSCGGRSICGMESVFRPAAGKYRSVSAKKTVRVMVILLGCFLAGAFLLYGENLSAQRAAAAFEPAEAGEKNGGKQSEFYGTVTEIVRKEKDSYQICVKSGREKILLSYYREIENYPALTGCSVKVKCMPEKPAEAGNPRTFDYSLYLKSEGIYLTAAADSIELAAPPSGLYNRVKNRVICARENMLSDMKLSSEAEGFLRGVLFGDTKGLDEEIYREFRENSTAHVLAVSGLHVGMLYGIYRKLYQRKKSRLFTAAFAALLLLYGTTTLWSVSVRRAVILILFFLGADLAERRCDMLTALAFAALVSAAENPYVIFGAGFQMSFLAVLSIIFLTPKLEKYVKAGSAAAVSVQFSLMPYMAYTFNYISLIGLICNIPVVFLVSILVPAGIGAFFLYLAVGFMPPVLPSVCEGLSVITVKVNHLFAGADYLSFDAVSPPLWCVTLFYLFLFFAVSEYFAVYFVRKELKKFLLPAAAIALAAAVSFYAGASEFDKASAVFVDVGQGDCLHLKTKEGRNILIDGGGSIRYNVGEKTLKPYLLKNGAGSVELAAATHLHTDHFLGLSQLAEVFPVKAFLTEGQAGQVFSLGEDCRLELLWPLEKAADSEDENLNSLIFKVHLYGVTILMTGDITEEGERLLLARYQGTDVLKADILKVAHHGSSYSTCDDFLDAVNPAVSVISVGKNNYGHPGDKVIEKMQKKGIMIFRTDLNGAVGVITDRKGNFSICTEKKRNTAFRNFQKT